MTGIFGKERGGSMVRVRTSVIRVNRILDLTLTSRETSFFSRGLADQCCKAIQGLFFMTSALYIASCSFLISHKGVILMSVVFLGIMPATINTCGSCQNILRAQPTE